MKNREDSIEFYRLILMFGIVFLHAGWRLGSAFCWENVGFLWCVDGFVFITGWFGCRFSVWKIVKLYGIAVYCAAIVEGLARYFGVSSEPCFVAGMWKQVKGWWFLHAYVFMMCLAPLVDGALSWRLRFSTVMPLLLLAFGWGFATEFPIVHAYVPTTPGIGSFTGITLLGVYAFARWYRLAGIDDRLNRKIHLVSISVLVGLSVLGNGWFGHYASPVSLVLAAMIFSFCKRVKVLGIIGRILLLLTPSLFSIYLIHCNDYGYKLMDQAGRAYLSHYPVPVACLILSICMFVGSLILDVPRRLGIVMVRIVKGWRVAR